MKKLTTNLYRLTLAICVAVLMSSCMTTKTNVGAFRESQGHEYTYAKGRQLWLFWGLLPLGRTSVSTPGDGNCQVITKLNFGDFLIYGITGGFVVTESIKVVAKKK